MTNRGIAAGDEVDVTVQERPIIGSSSQHIRGKYRLEDLLRQMTEAQSLLAVAQVDHAHA